MALAAAMATDTSRMGDGDSLSLILAHRDQPRRKSALKRLVTSTPTADTTDTACGCGQLGCGASVGLLGGLSLVRRAHYIGTLYNRRDANRAGTRQRRRARRRRQRASARRARTLGSWI